MRQAQQIVQVVTVHVELTERYQASDSHCRIHLCGIFPPLEHEARHDSLCLDGSAFGMGKTDEALAATLDLTRMRRGDFFSHIHAYIHA